MRLCGARSSDPPPRGGARRCQSSVSLEKEGVTGDGRGLWRHFLNPCGQACQAHLSLWEQQTGILETRWFRKIRSRWFPGSGDAACASPALGLSSLPVSPAWPCGEAARRSRCAVLVPWTGSSQHWGCGVGRVSLPRPSLAQGSCLDHDEDRQALLQLHPASLHIQGLFPSPTGPRVTRARPWRGTGWSVPVLRQGPRTRGAGARAPDPRLSPPPPLKHPYMPRSEAC